MIPETPVRYLDCGYDHRIDSRRYIEILKSYPVICLSCESPLVALNMELTVRLIRKHNPDAIVILGGHHATFYPHEWLGRGADIVIRHEGEATFQSVIRSLAAGESIRNLPGISYMGNDRIPVDEEDASFICELDDMPMPNWDMVDFSIYRYRLREGGPPATIEAARGCPHHCSFCCAAVMWKNSQRFKQPSRILDEMEALVGKGVGQILFADDNFAARRDRDSAVFEGVLSRQYKLGFWCFIRADAVLDNPDFIALAARAGLRQVFVGYESINQEILKQYRKSPRNALQASDYREVYRILHENGVFVQGLFVRDFDEEKESLTSFFDWLQITKISDITAQTRFIPMRGVPGVEEILERGYEVKDMFYHDRFIPAYRRKGKSQGSAYLLVELYDVFKPRNFIRMIAGSFVERAFFRSLYRGILSDLFHLTAVGVKAFFTSLRPDLSLDERQERVVAMFRAAYGVSEENTGAGT